MNTQVTQDSTKKGLKLSTSFWLLLFILLLSLNLRGPVTGVPPLLERISEALSLNSSQTGLITSIPLLTFALFAPLASWLTRFFSIERILACGALFIAVGIVVRSLGSLSLLYGGVIFIGVGVAIGNVLLPSLLKREFADKVVQLTSIYVLMMSIGGFLMSSMVVPLDSWAQQFEPDVALSSWGIALLSQIAFILVPLFIGFSGLLSQKNHSSSTASSINVWRSLQAWQVGGFLALNSLFNYSVIAWVPAILVSYGYTETTAGLYQGYVQLAGALPSLILAPFIRHLGSHRRLCMIATGLGLSSIFGLLYLPNFAGLWAFVFGFGVSMSYILGLSFVSLRAQSPRHAAAMSGMSQFLGYGLAAMGPVVIGLLHDQFTSWQPPLYGFVTMGILCCVSGWYASPKQHAQ